MSRRSTRRRAEWDRSELLQAAQARLDAAAAAHREACSKHGRLGSARSRQARDLAAEEVTAATHALLEAIRDVFRL